MKTGISHYLLDIEGTTCPVSFVTGTLFPYASDQMGAFLERNQHQDRVLKLVEELEEEWKDDPHPEAVALRAEAPDECVPWRVLPYLHWLMAHDRKLTALKELQGMVWEQGYASGELVGPLFSDVPAALRRWRAAGKVLAVYSSGSVKAQQLLYRHSNGGDLGELFSHWFDTRCGQKQTSASYTAIAAAMAVEPDRILFISDTVGELQAATDAGMKVLFSLREGNPQSDPGAFTSIINFNEFCSD
ncbi:acireductone synthase [Synechococcus sp. CCY 9618]|uniref:acireductone synthase n=1 Tax=Synechococcus sp. CCY 9618 TaxID=2815602 RepID=UPI001C24DD43|nr:acireductone synthase [Synechococcus sp. CCY 9618]